MMNEQVEAEVFKTTDIGDSPLKLLVQKEEQAKTGEATKVGIYNWVPMRVSPEDLLQFFDMNVWHRRCIDVKAALICGLGWELVTDEEDKSEDAAWKAIHGLLDRPNEHREETFTELNMRFLIDYMAIGNGYLEVARNLKGEVANIYHIRGKTVRRDRQLKTGGYWQGLKDSERNVHFNNFGERQIDPKRNEMLQYLSYDPFNDYYGIPGWFPALADMLMDRSIAAYYINVFDNQLMAEFAIIVEGGKLSAKALRSVKNYIKHNYSGIDQAGKTIILNSESKDVKIKIEKLTIDFGKSDINELRSQARDFVLSAHGVPPRMAGVVAGGQLGGGGEVTGQLKTFKETEINPAQAKLEAFYNNTILASFGDHKWKLKFNQLDITDRTNDADYWTKALNKMTGWADRAEAREDQGMPPEDVSAGFDSAQPAVNEPLPIIGQLGEQIEAFRKSLDSAAGYQPVE